ncbi:MAG: hypothetical protein OMM_10593 [Candidatus Magnetoglobus multicellularis str. Araruama]|uniref:Uncharacterized protein n=1 Tax=Candidatus Magnetoglobus multicellularis str. Araruama TaxID=890399 RepID=A0A1V1P0T3_9BACT|nr:MAG: hypothetical protein OMM_10593 [Candidatus Magnetoglobus multicellularis str. Araruama]
MAYCELNQIETAVFAFKKALDINPNSADTHFWLAVSYSLDSKNDRLAENEFIKTIKIDPDHLDARFKLFSLYVKNNEVGKAMQQLQEILIIDPGNKMAQDLLEKKEK